MSVKPPLTTDPAVYVMATSEALPLRFNTAKLLQLGQSMSNPVFVMTDTKTGKVIDLPGPNIDGNFAIQDVDGDILLARHSYELALSFNAEDDTVWTMILTIQVPQ